MVRAKYSDRSLIVKILTNSFDENQNVNYIITQDDKRVDRIKNLMEHSFDMCYFFGEVFLSEDKKGCALLPDEKKTNLKSILLDIKLTISCIGSNIKKAIDRQAKIKKLQPKDVMYYLRFIGVDPKEQNRGIGSRLLTEVIKEGFSKGRPVYLETSTAKTIPWYEKFGFKIYNELDLSYRLFFMKNDN